MALFAAGDQTLLWKISNVCSKNWIYSTYMFVSTGNVDPFLSSSNYGSEYTPHTVVKKSISLNGANVIREVIEFRHRKVSNEYRSMRCWFSAYRFGNVS